MNKFWVVSSNQRVLNSISKINKRNCGVSISTFDFSTLYTKIPHDLLFEAMDKVVDLVFHRRTNQCIFVNKSATWSSSPTCKFVRCRSYDKQKIKSAIKYLIQNCFFTVGQEVFQQIIGIPMGSDPAPFFANLFLYTYESEWIKGLERSDPSRARCYANIFRYIDDLIALNDKDEFLNSFHQIYPREMQLKKENLVNNSATFLDIDIGINERVITTSLYDKRDDFGFEIVRMPYASSNIPSKMFYATICAETLRIARVTSSLQTFLHSIQEVLKRMLRQGANLGRLQANFNKMVNRHQLTFSKYNTSTEQLVELLLSSSANDEY